MMKIDDGVFLPTPRNRRYIIKCFEEDKEEALQMIYQKALQQYKEWKEICDKVVDKMERKIQEVDYIDIINQLGEKK